MQAIVELIAAVVIWLAVTTLNQFGVEVDLSRPEPKAERVIQRESAPAAEAVSHDVPCPDEVAPPARTDAKAA
ncbi:MAG TPA: hypothetical protein VEA44_03630 [Caulobacter sp.]|nr:hypothetical protein [Caulobacter sp.]